MAGAQPITAMCICIIFFAIIIPLNLISKKKKKGNNRSPFDHTSKKKKICKEQFNILYGIPNGTLSYT
ncbi:hypothetical protein NC651_025070 [Populus alba x Populus x berolinensis]|nr:hypothetical protein NC651_025070 [Populus alba x Populus x berolinensis]